MPLLIHEQFQVVLRHLAPFEVSLDHFDYLRRKLWFGTVMCSTPLRELLSRQEAAPKQKSGATVLLLPFSS